MGNRIIGIKDRNNTEFEGVFNSIENNNADLYNFLIVMLKNNQNTGIREDVLRFLGEHGGEFNSSDKNFTHCLVGLAVNPKMVPDFLLWVNSFLNRNKNYSVDDFEVTVTEAIKKGIPYSKIKELFDSGKYDEVEMLYEIQQYTPDLFADETEPVAEPEPVVSNNEQAYVVETFAKADVPETNNEYTEIRQGTEASYTDMINSLITVMSPKNYNGSSKSIDDNLHSIIAKFQLATTELQSYSSEIVGELDRKDEEIKRLNALLTIQKNLITSHQNKISEQRMEIDRLNAKILNAEKTEMKREAINQKISELQSLTLGTRTSDTSF
jgi:hypothetical protein